MFHNYLDSATGLSKGGYHHHYNYHPYQLQPLLCPEEKEEEDREVEGKEVMEEEEEKYMVQGMGGAVARPAIRAAARCAVMVAAAIQHQMRCYMPAVVDNQLQKFETDPEIRQLVGPAQIAFAGLPHAPPAERRNALLQNCTDRHQPHLPITFTQFGYNSDFSLSSCTVGQEEITFESRCILNGVCVILRGTMNRETLTGTSTLQFDEENAAAEEERRQQAMHRYGDRIQAIRRRFNLPQS